MNEKKILFVSVVKDPYKWGSSTNILTENLLSGLRENGYSVYFVAIYERHENVENIVKYYNQYAKVIIPIESKMNLGEVSHNKYKALYRVIRGFIFYKRYRKDICNDDFASVYYDDEMILLSHTPSLEAAFICKVLVKQYKFRRHVQFWSDPHALSGIYLENFSIKRWPSYIIEKSLLKLADSVVYPGKPLYMAQSKLFKKYSSRMRCVDFSYSCKTIPPRDEKLVNDKPLFGYVGNYMTYVRNIKPLFEAFSTDIGANLLVCGKGDVSPENCDNIIIEKSLPQSDILELEEKIDVFIAIINHSCYQLPGKIFYQSNQNKVILIILDGKCKDMMYEYLSSFNRFEFCENNKESIIKAVKRICRGEYEAQLSCLDVLSPKYVAKSILNSD